MPLSYRKRVAKVVLETVKGTKEDADQAILIIDNFKIDKESTKVQRKGSGLRLGNEHKAIETEVTGRCSFDAELRGNGSGACDPAVAALLQCCSFLKAAEVYSLHSGLDAQKTCSIDVWEDGVKKGLAGATGNVTVTGKPGGIMLCKFELQGRWIDPTDAALPVHVPGTGLPIIFEDGVCTLGGSTIHLSEFEINVNAALTKRPDASKKHGLGYMINGDHDPTFKFDPEADTVANDDIYGDDADGTEYALVIEAATTADKVTINAPKCQYREISEGDRENIEIYDTTMQLNNDGVNSPLTITFSAAV